MTDGPLSRNSGKVWVWDSEAHPGYFHLAGVARDLAFAEATRKPTSGQAPEHLFDRLDLVLERRFDDVRFATLPPSLRQFCEKLREAITADHDADGLVRRACELVEQADARLAALQSF